MNGAKRSGSSNGANPHRLSSPAHPTTPTTQSQRKNAHSCPKKSHLSQTKPERTYQLSTLPPLPPSTLLTPPQIRTPLFHPPNSTPTRPRSLPIGPPQHVHSLASVRASRKTPLFGVKPTLIAGSSPLPGAGSVKLSPSNPALPTESDLIRLDETSRDEIFQLTSGIPSIPRVKRRLRNSRRSRLNKPFPSITPQSAVLNTLLHQFNALSRSSLHSTTKLNKLKRSKIYKSTHTGPARFKRQSLLALSHANFASSATTHKQRHCAKPDASPNTPPLNEAAGMTNNTYDALPSAPIISSSILPTSRINTKPNLDKSKYNAFSKLISPTPPSSSPSDHASSREHHTTHSSSSKKTIKSVFAGLPKGIIYHTRLTDAIPTKIHPPTPHQTFKSHLAKTDSVQKPLLQTSTTVEKILGLPLVQPTHDPSNYNADSNNNHYDFAERLLGHNLLNSKRHAVSKTILHQVLQGSDENGAPFEKIQRSAELAQILDSYLTYTPEDEENVQTADMYTQFLAQQSITACGNNVEEGIRDFLSHSAQFSDTNQRVVSTVHSTLLAMHKLTQLPAQSRTSISSASVCALIDLFEEIIDLDALSDEIQTRCAIISQGTDEEKEAVTLHKISAQNHEFFLWLLSNREIKHLAESYLSGAVIHHEPRIADIKSTHTKITTNLTTNHDSTHNRHDAGAFTNNLVTPHRIASRTTNPVRTTFNPIALDSKPLFPRRDIPLSTIRQRRHKFLNNRPSIDHFISTFDDPVKLKKVFVKRQELTTPFAKKSKKKSTHISPQHLVSRALPKVPNHYSSIFTNPTATTSDMVYELHVRTLDSLASTLRNNALSETAATLPAHLTHIDSTSTQDIIAAMQSEVEQHNPQYQQSRHANLTLLNYKRHINTRVELTQQDIVICLDQILRTLGFTAGHHRDETESYQLISPSDSNPPQYTLPQSLRPSSTSTITALYLQQQLEVEQQSGEANIENVSLQLPLLTSLCSLLLQHGVLAADSQPQPQRSQRQDSDHSLDLLLKTFRIASVLGFSNDLDFNWLISSPPKSPLSPPALLEFNNQDHFHPGSTINSFSKHVLKLDRYSSDINYLTEALSTLHNQQPNPSDSSEYLPRLPAQTETLFLTALKELDSLSLGDAGKDVTLIDGSALFTVPMTGLKSNSNHHFRRVIDGDGNVTTVPVSSEEARDGLRARAEARYLQDIRPVTDLQPIDQMNFAARPIGLTSAIYSAIRDASANLGVLPLSDTLYQLHASHPNDPNTKAMNNIPSIIRFTKFHHFSSCIERLVISPYQSTTSETRIKVNTGLVARSLALIPPPSKQSILHSTTQINYPIRSEMYFKPSEASPAYQPLNNVKHWAPDPTSLFDFSFSALQHFFSNSSTNIEPSHYLKQLTLDQRKPFRDNTTNIRLRLAISRIKHKHALEQLANENNLYSKLTNGQSPPPSLGAQVYEFAAQPPPFSSQFRLERQQQHDHVTTDSSDSYTDSDEFYLYEMEENDSADTEQQHLPRTVRRHDQQLLNHTLFKNELPDELHRVLDEHTTHLAAQANPQDLVAFANDPQIPLSCKAALLMKLLNTAILPSKQANSKVKGYITLPDLKFQSSPSAYLAEYLDNDDFVVCSHNAMLSNVDLGNICEALFNSLTTARSKHQYELMQLKSLFNSPTSTPLSNSTIGQQFLATSATADFDSVFSSAFFDPYQAVLPISNIDNALYQHILANPEDDLASHFTYAPFQPPSGSDEAIIDPISKQLTASLTQRHNGAIFYHPYDPLARPLLSSPHLSPFHYSLDSIGGESASSTSILSDFIHHDLHLVSQLSTVQARLTQEYEVRNPNLTPNALHHYVQDEIREKIVFLPYPQPTTPLNVARMNLMEATAEETREFRPLYRSPPSLLTDPTCATIVNSSNTTSSIQDYYRLILPHLTSFETIRASQCGMLRDAHEFISHGFDGSAHLAIYTDATARKIRTVCDFGGVPVFLHTPTYSEPFQPNPFADTYDVCVDGIPVRENVLPRHSLHRLAEFASMISSNASNSYGAKDNNPFDPDSVNAQALTQSRQVGEFPQVSLPKSLFQNLLAVKCATLFEDYFFNHDKRADWAHAGQAAHLDFQLRSPFMAIRHIGELSAQFQPTNSPRTKQHIAMDLIQDISNFVLKMPHNAAASLDPLLLRQLHLCLISIPDHLGDSVIDDLAEKYNRSMQVESESHRAMINYAQHHYPMLHHNDPEKQHFDMRSDQDKLLAGYLTTLTSLRQRNEIRTDPLAHLSHAIAPTEGTRPDLIPNDHNQNQSLGSLSQMVFLRRKLATLSESQLQYLTSFHYAPGYLSDEIVVTRASSILQLDADSLASLPPSFHFDLPPAGIVHWNNLRSTTLLDHNYQLLDHYIKHPTIPRFEQTQDPKPWFFTWNPQGKLLLHEDDPKTINPELSFSPQSLLAHTERYYPLRPNFTIVPQMNPSNPFKPLRDTNPTPSTQDIALQTRNARSFSGETQQFVSAIFHDIAGLLANTNYQPLYSSFHLPAPPSGFIDRRRLSSSWSQQTIFPNETSFQSITPAEAPNELMSLYTTSARMSQLSYHYNGHVIMSGQHSFPWAYSPFSPSGPSENEMIKMKPIYTLNHAIATASQQVELWKDQLRGLNALPAPLSNHLGDGKNTTRIHSHLTTQSDYLTDPTLDFIAATRPPRPTLLHPTNQGHLYLSLAYFKRVKARQAQILKHSLLRSPSDNARSPHPRRLNLRKAKTPQAQESQALHLPSYWSSATAKDFKAKTRVKMLRAGVESQYNAHRRRFRAESVLKLDPADWQLRFDATSSPTNGLFFNEDELFPTSHSRSIIDQLSASSQVLRSPNLNYVNVLQNLITFTQHIASHDVDYPRRRPPEQLEHVTTPIPPHIQPVKAPSQLYLGTFLQSLPHFLKLQLPVILPVLIGRPTRVSQFVPAHFQSTVARIWTGRVHASFAWPEFLGDGAPIPFGSPLFEEKLSSRPEVYEGIDSATASHLASFLTFKKEEHVSAPYQSQVQSHRFPITSLHPAIQQHLALLYNDIGFNYDHIKPDQTMPYFHHPSITNAEGNAQQSPFSADILTHKRESITLGELQAHSVRPISLFDGVTAFHDSNRAALPSLISAIMHIDLNKALQSPILHQRSVAAAAQAIQSNSKYEAVPEHAAVVPFSPLFTQIAHLAQSLLDTTALSHEFIQTTSDSAPTTQFQSSNHQLPTQLQDILHGGSLTDYCGSHKTFPRHRLKSRRQRRSGRKKFLARLLTRYRGSELNTVSSFNLLHFGGDDDRQEVGLRRLGPQSRSKDPHSSDLALQEAEFMEQIEQPEINEFIPSSHPPIYERGAAGSQYNDYLDPKSYIHDLQVVNDPPALAQQLNNHRIAFTQNILQPPITHRLSPASISVGQTVALIAGLLNLPEHRASLIDTISAYTSPTASNLIALSSTQLGYRPIVTDPYSLRQESTIVAGFLQRLHHLQKMLYFSNAPTQTAFIRQIATDLSSNRTFSHLNNLQMHSDPPRLRVPSASIVSTEITSQYQNLALVDKYLRDPQYLETISNHEIDRHHMTAAALTLAKVLTQDVSVRISGHNIINPLFPTQALHQRALLNKASAFQPVLDAEQRKRSGFLATTQDRVSILWNHLDTAAFHSILPPDFAPDNTEVDVDISSIDKLALNIDDQDEIPHSLPHHNTNHYHNDNSWSKYNQHFKPPRKQSFQFHRSSPAPSPPSPPSPPSHPFADPRPVTEPRADRLRRYLPHRLVRGESNPLAEALTDEALETVHQKHFGKVFLYSTFVDHMPDILHDILLSSVDQIVPRVSAYRNFYVLPAIYQYNLDTKLFPGLDHASRITHLELENKLDENRRLYQQQQSNLSEKHFVSQHKQQLMDDHFMLESGQPSSMLLDSSLFESSAFDSFTYSTLVEEHATPTESRILFDYLTRHTYRSSLSRARHVLFSYNPHDYCSYEINPTVNNPQTHAFNPATFNYLLTTQLRMFAQINRLQRNHAQHSARIYLSSRRNEHFDLNGMIAKTDRTLTKISRSDQVPLRPIHPATPLQAINFTKRSNNNVEDQKTIGHLVNYGLFSSTPQPVDKYLFFPAPPDPSIITNANHQTDPWVTHEEQTKAAETRLVERFAYGTTRLRNMVLTLLDDVQHTDYILRSELKHGILQLPHIRALIEQLTHGEIVDDPDRLDVKFNSIIPSSSPRPINELLVNDRGQLSMTMAKFSTGLKNASLEFQFLNIPATSSGNNLFPTNPPRDLALKRFYAYIGLDKVISRLPDGRINPLSRNLQKIDPSQLVEMSTSSSPGHENRFVHEGEGEGEGENIEPSGSSLYFRNRGLVFRDLFNPHNTLSGYEIAPNYYSHVDFLRAKIDVVAAKSLLPTILIRASDAIFNEIATAIRTVNIIEKTSDHLEPRRSHENVTFSPRLLSQFSSLPSPKRTNPNVPEYNVMGQLSASAPGGLPSQAVAAERGYLSKQYGVTTVPSTSMEFHTIPFLYNHEYLTNIIAVCFSNYLHSELLQLTNVIITSPNLPAQPHLNPQVGVTHHPSPQSPKYLVKHKHRIDNNEWRHFDFAAAHDPDTPSRENVNTLQSPFIQHSTDIRHAAIQSVMTMFCFSRQEPIDALKFWTRIQFQKKRLVVEDLVQDWRKMVTKLENADSLSNEDRELSLNPSFVTLFSKTIDDLCRLPQDYIAPQYASTTTSPDNQPTSTQHDIDLSTVFQQPQDHINYTTSLTHDHDNNDKYSDEQTRTLEYLRTQTTPNHHLLKYDSIYPVARDHAFSPTQLNPLALSLLAHPSHFESYFKPTPFNSAETKNRVKDYLLHYRHIIDAVDTNFAPQIQLQGLSVQFKTPHIMNKIGQLNTRSQPSASFITTLEHQLNRFVSINDQRSSMTPSNHGDSGDDDGKFTFQFTPAQVHLRNKLMSLFTVSALPHLLQDLRLNEEFPQYIDPTTKDIVTSVDLVLNSHGFPSFSQFMARFKTTIVNPLKRSGTGSNSQIDSMFKLDKFSLNQAPLSSPPQDSFDAMKRRALGLGLDHQTAQTIHRTFLDSLYNDFAQPSLYNINGPFANDPRYHTPDSVHSEQAYNSLNFSQFNIDLIAQLAIHYTFATPYPADFSLVRHYSSAIPSIPEIYPAVPKGSSPDQNRTRSWLQTSAQSDLFHNSNSPFAPHSIPNKMVKLYQLRDFNSVRLVDQELFSPQAAQDETSPYHQQAKLIHEPTQYSPISLAEMNLTTPLRKSQLLVNTQFPYCRDEDQWVDNINATLNLQSSWVHPSPNTDNPRAPRKPPSLGKHDTYLM